MFLIVDGDGCWYEGPLVCICTHTRHPASPARGSSGKIHIETSRRTLFLSCSQPYVHTVTTKRVAKMPYIWGCSLCIHPRNDLMETLTWVTLMEVVIRTTDPSHREIPPCLPYPTQSLTHALSVCQRSSRNIAVQGKIIQKSGCSVRIRLMADDWQGTGQRQARLSASGRVMFQVAPKPPPLSFIFHAWLRGG